MVKTDYSVNKGGLVERNRNKRMLIHEALERIDSGTFGLCDDCGEEMILGRLKTRTVATARG